MLGRAAQRKALMVARLDHTQPGLMQVLDLKSNLIEHGHVFVRRTVVALVCVPGDESRAGFILSETLENGTAAAIMAPPVEP